MNPLHRRTILPLLAFTILAFVVTGYHPGAEDDNLYVSAVKADLNPALYPHDLGFIKLQLRTSIFDSAMAAFVRATGVPVCWAELLWQLLSAFGILCAAWTILVELFEEDSARWGAIAMLGAMFTLPVAGTGLYIVDQYLHPRAIATALILFAVSRILRGGRWQAVPLLAIASLEHPLMGVLGISFCAVYSLVLVQPVHGRLRSIVWREAPQTAPAVVLLPLQWIFGTPTDPWMKAMATRHWFRIDQWTWYEWLGVIGPLVIFWFVSRIAQRQGRTRLAELATAIFVYCAFQQSLALLLLRPGASLPLSAVEPMRYLHLVYIFLALTGGALLGRYVLGHRLWRWAAFLVVINGPMLYAQRQLFPGTEQIELPGVASGNPWLEAFAWIRTNTPTNAYFALDPYYMARPGEDYRGFRPLAERSRLADEIEDTAVITKVPELGHAWEEQVAAQNGWERFRLADFERLKAQFGVDWVLVSYPQPAGLDCRWHNRILAVCRVP